MPGPVATWGVQNATVATPKMQALEIDLRVEIPFEAFVRIVLDAYLESDSRCRPFGRSLGPWCCGERQRFQFAIAWGGSSRRRCPRGFRLSGQGRNGNGLNVGHPATAFEPHGERRLAERAADGPAQHTFG
jgi:hypothetical protein